MKKLNNKGFTLVELIVVIAVLAVITMVAAPQLIEYVEKSRVGTDKNALGEVAHAAEVAYAAYGKEKNENVIDVRISSKGVASYGPNDSTLVQAVSKTLAEDAYIYKSKTYRNSTHKIIISDMGVASVEGDTHIDIATTLQNTPVGTIGSIIGALGGIDADNYKDYIEQLVWKATAENTGSFFRPNYVNGYEMTEDDWETISNAAFEAGEDADYIKDRIDQKDVGYFLDKLGITI